MDITKIVLMAVMAVITCGLIKAAGSGLHIYVSMAVCVLIMMATLVRLSGVIDALGRILGYLEYADQYVRILIKVVLVTYITSFTADICRDSGYSAVANQVELFGKVTIALLCVPIVLELLDMTVIQALGAEKEYQYVIEIPVDNFENQIEDFHDENKKHDNSRLCDNIGYYNEKSYDYSEIDDILNKSDISFGDIVKKLINGEYTLETFIKQIITDELDNIADYKRIFINIAFLAFIYGIIRNISIAGNTDTMNTARLIIMAGLALLLTSIFKNTYELAYKTIRTSLSIYEAVMPVFMASVAVITGSVTYAAFYQVVLLSMTVADSVFLHILLVGIKADYYLTIANGISDTDRFGRLCALIEAFIKWTCRIILIGFTGIGCVKGLMAPMSDSLKRTLFYKSVKIIPGVGDSIDVMSQALYGSGTLIKNSIGIGGMAVVIIVTASPVIKILINFLLLKLTAALLQPVADKAFIKIVEAVATIIGLMLLVVCVSDVLFILLIGLICACTN